MITNKYSACVFWNIFTGFSLQKLLTLFVDRAHILCIVCSINLESFGSLSLPFPKLMYSITLECWFIINLKRLKIKDSLENIFRIAILCKRGKEILSSSLLCFSITA